MFKKGNLLKVNLQVAEDHYSGAKGTTVYDTMMEQARNYTFKVLEVTPSGYKLERKPDGELLDANLEEAHQYFELIS